MKVGATVLLIGLIASLGISVRAGALDAGPGGAAGSGGSNDVDVVAAFQDVAPSDYFAPAVRWAIRQGITKGTSATTFSPSMPCTRGQVVTFLWRAEGCPGSDGEVSFTDVSETAYYHDAVAWATEKAITNGVTKTTFAPHRTCTRAHILTFLWREDGSPVISSDGALAADYKDHWASGALAWAEAHHLLDGTGETFRPDEECPRADVLLYLFRTSASDAERRAAGEGPALYEADTQEAFADAVSALIREFEGQVSVSDDSDHATGRLIVKASSLPPLDEYHPVRIIRDPEDHYVIQFTSDLDARACAEHLQTLPEVVYAEPDQIVTADVGGRDGSSLDIG